MPPPHEGEDVAITSPREISNKYWEYARSQMGKSTISIMMEVFTVPPEFSAIIVNSVGACSALGIPEITPDWLIDSPWTRSG